MKVKLLAKVTTKENCCEHAFLQLIQDVKAKRNTHGGNSIKRIGG